jgi:hypothetical protein
MARQTAKDRAFVAKLKGLARWGMPTHDSAWTSKGRSYCSTLVRKEYAGIDPRTGRKMVDPEAFISSPAEAKEVLKRQGRWGSDTEIEAL